MGEQDAEPEQVAEGRKRVEPGVTTPADLDAIGRLAGGIAHDFNNVLGAVSGFAEILLEGRPVDDPDRPKLEQIRAATQRGFALTRRLAAFGGRQIVRPQKTAVDELVCGLAPTLRRMFGEAIEIELDLASGLWPVHADPGQLEEALIQLALNARDAMPGGGRLRVAAANVDAGDAEAPDADRLELDAGQYVHLTVADEGIGMGDETIAHAFEPFFTRKSGRAASGLGLPTVYGIVKQCGGRVVVESGRGRGSAISLYFPRAVRSGEGNGPGIPSIESASGGGETILIVDDSAPMRSLVAGVLARAGYQVIESSSPAAALAATEAHEGSLDLLLADVRMPGMTGPELARRLAERRPGLPVLFMTAHPGNALDDSPAEAIDVLLKPFTIPQLLARLRLALDGGRTPNPSSRGMPRLGPSRAGEVP